MKQNYTKRRNTRIKKKQERSENEWENLLTWIKVQQLTGAKARKEMKKETRLRSKGFSLERLWTWT